MAHFYTETLEKKSCKSADRISGTYRIDVQKRLSHVLIITPNRH